MINWIFWIGMGFALGVLFTWEKLEGVRQWLKEKAKAIGDKLHDDKSKPVSP